MSAPPPPSQPPLRRRRRRGNGATLPQLLGGLRLGGIFKGTFRLVLWLGAPAAIAYGGYLLIHQARAREVKTCLVTDFEYRMQNPDWEAGIKPLFAEVNRIFEKAGVTFEIAMGGDAYPEASTGTMAERWQRVAESTCKADIVVGLTGRTDRDDSAVALPFSHAVLIKDTGGSSGATNAGVMARAIANLYGVPVGIQSISTSQDGVLDDSAIRIIRKLRDYDFARGVAALPGKWEERAIAALTEALAGKDLRPAAVAHRIVARAFASGRQYGDAVRHMREAVRADSQDSALRFELAMDLQSDSQPDQAIQELREAERMAPDNALTHAALGAICLNTGHIDEAVEELRTAARLEPRNASYQTALGAALSQRPGMVKDAAAAFDAAVKLRPSESGAYAGLESEIKLQAQIQERLQEALTRVKQQPSSVEAHNQLALAYGDAGNLEAARAEVKRSFELAPNNGQAHLILAELHFLEGGYAAAASEVAAAQAAGARPRSSLVEQLNRKLGR